MTSLTLELVIRSTPFFNAFGQYVMSELDFAPWGQPVLQGPKFLHAPLPSFSLVIIAL